MPTLEWIGKGKVVNHHQEVPYRVLERQYSYDEAGQHAEDNGSENMIIRGDNLEALKALLPRHEVRVKRVIRGYGEARTPPAHRGRFQLLRAGRTAPRRRAPERKHLRRENPGIHLVHGDKDSARAADVLQSLLSRQAKRHGVLFLLRAAAPRCWATVFCPP